MSFASGTQLSTLNSSLARARAVRPTEQLSLCSLSCSARLAACVRQRAPLLTSMRRAQHRSRLPSRAKLCTEFDVSSSSR